MRFYLILFCFSVITYSCDSVFEKKYNIKNNVNTLSKDDIKIDFEFNIEIEFYGAESEFDELLNQYKSDIDYSIRAMLTSIIRSVIGRYTKEEIDHKIPKEEIKEMVADYLNNINFKIVDFTIHKRQD